MLTKPQSCFSSEPFLSLSIEKLELKLERSVTVNKQIKIYRPNFLKKMNKMKKKVTLNGFFKKNF